MTTNLQTPAWAIAAVLVGRLIFAAIFLMALTFKVMDIDGTAAYIASAGFPASTTSRIYRQPSGREPSMSVKRLPVPMRTIRISRKGRHGAPDETGSLGDHEMRHVRRCVTPVFFPHAERVQHQLRT